MDEKWYDHNLKTNSIGIKNIASLKAEDKYLGKIIAKENITIAPKSRLNIKQIQIDTNKQEKIYEIESVERLYKNKYLILKTHIDN